MQHRAGLRAAQPGDGVAAGPRFGHHTAEEHLQSDVVGEPPRIFAAVPVPPDAQQPTGHRAQDTRLVAGLQQLDPGGSLRAAHRVGQQRAQVVPRLHHAHERVGLFGVPRQPPTGRAKPVLVFVVHPRELRCRELTERLGAETGDIALGQRRQLPAGYARHRFRLILGEARCEVGVVGWQPVRVDHRRDVAGLPVRYVEQEPLPRLEPGGRVPHHHQLDTGALTQLQQPPPPGLRQGVRPQHHDLLDLVGAHPRGEDLPDRNTARDLLLGQPVHREPQPGENVEGQRVRRRRRRRRVHGDPTRRRPVRGQQCCGDRGVVVGIEQHRHWSRLGRSDLVVPPVTRMHGAGRGQRRGRLVRDDRDRLRTASAHPARPDSFENTQPSTSWSTTCRSRRVSARAACAVIFAQARKLPCPA